jgi:hypothetical protein
MFENQASYTVDKEIYSKCKSCPCPCNEGIQGGVEV